MYIFDGGNLNKLLCIKRGNSGVCQVTPDTESLLIFVGGGNVGAGQVYRIRIFEGQFQDEGSSQPVSLGASPVKYNGQVGTGESNYNIDVIPGNYYFLSVSEVAGSVSIRVDGGTEAFNSGACTISIYAGNAMGCILLAEQPLLLGVML